MLANSDVVFDRMLAALPVATYQSGTLVFEAGSKTGLLLFLKRGAVAITKEGTEIAKVVERGAVFGEMSALLGQPHSADVRTVEDSEFCVADAAAVMQDPVCLLYIATILAERLDVANQAFSRLKRDLDEGHRAADLVDQTIQAIETLLSASGPARAQAQATKLRFFGQR